MLFFKYCPFLRDSSFPKVSLGVDWPDLCSPWLVGLRHLVADVRFIRTSKKNNFYAKFKCVWLDSF